MITGQSGELTLESHVNVTAMADIVQRLLNGGVSQLQDVRWLRKHADEAGLSNDELNALQALQLRLSERGASFLSTTTKIPW